MTRYSRRSSGLLVPRHVDLGPPRVVHCMRERYHVYIGRPSVLGNPFVIGRDGTREECVELFERRLREDKRLLAIVRQLRGLVLGCFCAPRACHGDVCVRIANE